MHTLTHSPWPRVCCCTTPPPPPPPPLSLCQPQRRAVMSLAAWLLSKTVLYQCVPNTKCAAIYTKFLLIYLAHVAQPQYGKFNTLIKYTAFYFMYIYKCSCLCFRWMFNIWLCFFYSFVELHLNNSATNKSLNTQAMLIEDSAAKILAKPHIVVFSFVGYHINVTNIC